MRDLIQVNYLAVVLSAVAAMIVGGIWYGPLFGKKWMKLVGMSKADVNKKEMPKLYGIMFLGVLVEAFILSHFIHYAGAYTLFNGIKTGVWAWIGFVGVVMLGNYMFAKRPLKLFYIDAGYALVNLMIMGAILATLW